MGNADFRRLGFRMDACSSELSLFIDHRIYRISFGSKRYQLRFKRFSKDFLINYCRYRNRDSFKSLSRYGDGFVDFVGIFIPCHSDTIVNGFTDRNLSPFKEKEREKSKSREVGYC